MHLALSTSQLQQPKQVCLPRPSFAQLSPLDEKEPHQEKPSTECGLESYAIFPRCSVNLITCSSNSGKTRYLKEVISHRHKFFQHSETIQRILYVNCNKRDSTIEHPWTNSDQETLEFVSLALDEFSNFATLLEPNDLLVLDDLLQLDDSVQFIIKYGAHHFQLASVFVVTQSCLGSPLYSLIGSCHNLILLFGNSATTRLAQHLLQSFFLCTDTKKYLKSIFSLAEKHQDTVVLKLNAVASYRPHSQILAIAGVQRLFDSTYCFVYPELNYLEQMEQKATGYRAHVPSLEGERLQEAFVLLPASQVQMETNKTNDSEEKDCLKDKKQQWNDMADFLETEIENTFPFKKWNAAKNLTREILRCNELCISADFRTVFIREKPKMAFSIVDFLSASIRRPGPGESVDKVAMYRPLVLVLLRHHVPHAFFVNKLMLPMAGAKAKPRRHRHDRQHRYDEDDFYY